MVAWRKKKKASGSAHTGNLSGNKLSGLDAQRPCLRTSTSDAMDSLENLAGRHSLYALERMLTRCVATEHITHV
ncbi:hypothetical protein MRX96_057956 [Rhipicephalus microplus]